MPKYRVCADITSASGTQEFLVEAESADEALCKFRKGDCEFDCEDVPIDDIDTVNAEASLDEEGS